MNNSHETFTLFLDKQKDIYLDFKAVSIKCHMKQINPINTKIKFLYYPGLGYIR